MRILIDTSVWSLALRRGGPADHSAVAKLRSFLDSGEDLFLTGLILQEVLQAFRDDKVVARVAEHLEPFPLLPIEVDTCRFAADLFRKCRHRGLGASTVDCHIAASAIENDCHLLTTDRDFERLTQIGPLQLA